MIVTVLQTALEWENPAKNREMLEEWIMQMPYTDIIVLPEMFTTGFSMNPQKCAESMHGPTLQWMYTMACNKEALLIGSVMMEENGAFFNRLLAVSPEGIEAKYDKRHLFRMADEHQAYQAGEEKVVFEYKGWKICPMVCYDLRFPVWSRNTVNEKNALSYDLLIYVANWPERRAAHWIKLLQARAIENQCFVIGANRVGEDEMGISYLGQSMIVDFLGNVLNQGEDRQMGGLRRRLSMEELQAYREKFPAWKDADSFQII